MVHVEIPKLRTLIDGMIVATGCNYETTEIVGRSFFEAHLRGIDHHGLDYMPKFIEAIQSGKIAPNGKPSIVEEDRAHVLVNGNRGPGQLAGVFSADIAVQKVRKYGCAVVGVTNSSDLYMLGYYAEQMARQDVIGFVFSASPPAAHAFGGIDKVTGTNPLAVSIPTGDEDPFLLDMATTAWARASVREASYHNQAIPEGVAIGPNGEPTTDPVAAIEGAMSPLGGAKGFGLGLCVAFLSGPLVGSDVGQSMVSWNDQSGRPVGNKGHLFVGIDPAMFVSRDEFFDRMHSYIQEVKSSRLSSEASEITIPGDRTFRKRSEILNRGTVEIDDYVWQQSRELACSLGVSVVI